MIFNKENIIDNIFNFLDLTSLLSFELIDKLCYNLKKNVYKYLTSVERKLYIVNNKVFDTNLECENINQDTFNNCILQIIDCNIYLFLIDLLKTNLFYIGGSFALYFAHLYYNIPINDFDYHDSDIDIFAIANLDKVSEEFIQNTFYKIYEKHLGKPIIKDIHSVFIKRFIIDINFYEDLNIPKIQIVLHHKNSIQAHIEFIDLPITHFTLGNNLLYKTNLADYALHNKIIIIDYIYNDITTNRCIKYIDRGWTIIKRTKYGYINNPRLIGIFEKKYNQLIEYKIDCRLLDIIDLLKKLKDNYIFKISRDPSRDVCNTKILSRNKIFNKNKNIFENTAIINIDIIKDSSYNYNSKLYEALLSQKFIILTIKYEIKINKKYKYKYYSKNEYFDMVTIIENKTIISNYTKNYNKYYYTNDERQKINKNLLVLNSTPNKHKIKYKNLYFRYLSFDEIVTEQIFNTCFFFNNYCSYFLNLHKIKYTNKNLYTKIDSNYHNEIKIIIPNIKF